MDKYKRKYSEYVYYGDLYSNEGLDEIEIMNNYINTIVDQKYIYTKKDIAKIFDFNESFVQKFLVRNFKALFVTKPIKDILKTVDKEKKQESLIEYKAKELIDVLPQYKAELFYKEEDVLYWLVSNLQKEVYKRDKNGYIISKEKEDIDIEDAKILIRNGFKRNKTIQKEKGFTHPMQVSRYIKKALDEEALIKYTFANEGEKEFILYYNV